MTDSPSQTKTLRDLQAKFELFSELYSRTIQETKAQVDTNTRALEKLTWTVAEAHRRSEENYRVLHGHNGTTDKRGIVDFVYDHTRRFAFQDKLLWIIIGALAVLVVNAIWHRPTITAEQWRNMIQAVSALQRQQGQRALPSLEGP